MRVVNRSNALLVELLIVVMFFMLAFSVLLQVFAAAHEQSERAGTISRALAQAQNIAEQLYAAEKPETELEQMGFSLQDGEWVRDEAGWQTRVSAAREETAEGVLNRMEVRALSDGEELFSLPCARYDEEARP